MTLYEIDKKIETAIADIENKVTMDNGDVIDIDTGEVIDGDDYFNVMDAALNGLQLDKAEKLDNYGCYIKNLKADIKAIKEEENNLKNRREKKEKLIEVLEANLEDSLNGEKYESTRCQISFRKSTRLYINVPTDKLPYRFQKCIVKTEPDKIKLKKYIADGGEVEGCGLQERFNIQIK